MKPHRTPAHLPPEFRPGTIRTRVVRSQGKLVWTAWRTDVQDYDITATGATEDEAIENLGKSYREEEDA